MVHTDYISIMKYDEVVFFKSNGYFKYPKIVQFEVTNRCPLSCSQCYKGDNSDDMSLKIFKRYLKEAHSIGVKRIMINGGEPLINPNIVMMLIEADKLGITSVCYTSGFGVDEEFCSKIKELNVEWGLSFNASQSELNEISRDGFSLTLKACRMFKFHDINFFINWVARKDNVKDLKKLVEFAQSLGAKGVTVVANKLTGHMYIEEALSRDDYAHIKAVINKTSTNYVKPQICNGLQTMYNDEENFKSFHGCPTGVISLTITVDGRMVPCPHLYYPEKMISIQEYWNKSKVLMDIRKNKTCTLKYCSTCTRSNKCSFCRAMSIESHNDFSVGYIGCPLYQNVGVTNEI